VEEDRRREDDWLRENEEKLLEEARLAREKREQQRAELEEAGERQRLKDLHFMKRPKCGHDLVEENMLGIAVDRCGFCEGIFLDPRELDQLFLKKDDERKGFLKRVLGL
jgi:hypothetical protein